MKKKKLNKKMFQPDECSACKLRIFHRKAHNVKFGPGPRYLIKCGDCDAQLSIFYNDPFHRMDILEINGVFASKKEWAKLLLPLLK